MSTLTAIIRNPDDSGWLRYTDPQRTVIARHFEEVLPALQAIDAACAEGLTAVGYVAYDAAAAFDVSLQSQRGELPLLLFGLYRQGQAVTLPPAGDTHLTLGPELGKADFGRGLAAIKQHLANGDTYQVNYTQRLSGFCAEPPLQLFARLYQAQPSPLATFLDWQDLAVCSVSPELFFALDGDTINMEPMKGTRPRHPDPARDQQLRAELLTSDKEKAENLMIVDMVRNDLGRIAEPGSISARELFRIVQLPTVWQQVSRVRARTRASLTELFTALFPCASITGAPKASTMAIIKRLEQSPRGLYTGALGVVRPDRQMRFSVGIRTLLVDKARHYAQYGIGSGIVWDSGSDAEWQETLQKARVLNPRGQAFSLLETMRYEPGQGILRQTRHVDRLAATAAHFGIGFDAAAVSQQLAAIRAGSPLRVRLLMAGDGQFSLETAPAPAPAQPVRLRLAAAPVHSGDPFLRHKTTQREVYQAARAAVSDCDDVILFNERGELTETSIYNLYLELDGELLTPAACCGLLPGTLRQEMLDSGRAREARLSADDLQRASAVFVSNSLRGLCRAQWLSH